MDDNIAPRRKDRMPLFDVNNLSFRYPDGTLALRDVSLQIHQGDRIGLVGRNGSGKTTLARHLNGLYSCRHGLFTYRGETLTGDLLRAMRLEVGILFQDPDDHLFCNTLFDDVAFGPMNQGLPEDIVKDRVQKNIASVGLDHLLYKPAHLLSHGQKKRAAFAAVMAMNPDVLILDEPTAGLDPLQEKIFKKLLADYKGTLIIIDQDLLFLYELCDRAVVMAEGRLHHDFAFRDLISQPASLREHGLDFTFRFTCCGHHHDDKTPHHHHHHHVTTHAHNRKGHHLPVRAEETPLLELQHFSFRYPDNTPGLTDVNLIIRSRETIALVGENGAGKSTLAGCLLGVNRGEGYFLLDGTMVTGSRRRNLWKRIGMVFQNTADQLFCPSCREEVAFGPRQMGIRGKELDERVANALSQVQLQGFEDKVPLNMSGGERKRLAIAAVLSMGPEMLILDEPTAGLDPQGEEILLEILGNLGLTLILITHDLFFITRLTKRTVVIHRGEIIRNYSTEEFVNDHHLQAINELDYTYNNECCREIQKLQSLYS